MGALIEGLRYPGVTVDGVTYGVGDSFCWTGLTGQRYLVAIFFSCMNAKTPTKCTANKLTCTYGVCVFVFVCRFVSRINSLALHQTEFHGGDSDGEEGREGEKETDEGGEGEVDNRFRGSFSFGGRCKRVLTSRFQKCKYPKISTETVAFLAYLIVLVLPSNGAATCHRGK